MATGIFNAGTNIGAIVTPLVVPGVVLAFGWQVAFIVTGLAGLVWLPLWLLVYRTPREQPRVWRRRTGLYRAGSGRPGRKIGWLRLLGRARPGPSPWASS